MDWAFSNNMHNAASNPFSDDPFQSSNDEYNYYYNNNVTNDVDQYGFNLNGQNDGDCLLQIKGSFFEEDMIFQLIGQHDRDGLVQYLQQHQGNYDLDTISKSLKEIPQWLPYLSHSDHDDDGKKMKKYQHTKNFNPQQENFHPFPPHQQNPTSTQSSSLNTFPIIQTPSKFHNISITPLMMACICGFIEMIDILISIGNASIDTITMDGLDVLFISIIFQQYYTFCYLITKHQAVLNNSHIHRDTGYNIMFYLVENYIQLTTPPQLLSCITTGTYNVDPITAQCINYVDNNDNNNVNNNHNLLTTSNNINTLLSQSFSKSFPLSSEPLVAFPLEYVTSITSVCYDYYYQVICPHNTHNDSTNTSQHNITNTNNGLPGHNNTSINMSSATNTLSSSLPFDAPMLSPIRPVSSNIHTPSNINNNNNDNLNTNNNNTKSNNNKVDQTGNELSHSQFKQSPLQIDTQQRSFLPSPIQTQYATVVLQLIGSLTEVFSIDFQANNGSNILDIAHCSINMIAIGLDKQRYVLRGLLEKITKKDQSGGNDSNKGKIDLNGSDSDGIEPFLLPNDDDDGDVVSINHVNNNNNIEKTIEQPTRNAITIDTTSWQQIIKQKLKQCDGILTYLEQILLNFQSTLQFSHLPNSTLLLSLVSNKPISVINNYIDSPLTLLNHLFPHGSVLLTCLALKRYDVFLWLLMAHQDKLFNALCYSGPYHKHAHLAILTSVGTNNGEFNSKNDNSYPQQQQQQLQGNNNNDNNNNHIVNKNITPKSPSPSKQYNVPNNVRGVPLPSSILIEKRLDDYLDCICPRVNNDKNIENHIIDCYLDNAIPQDLFINLMVSLWKVKPLQIAPLITNNNNNNDNNQNSINHKNNNNNQNFNNRNDNNSLSKMSNSMTQSSPNSSIRHSTTSHHSLLLSLIHDDIRDTYISTFLRSHNLFYFRITLQYVPPTPTPPSQPRSPLVELLNQRLSKRSALVKLILQSYVSKITETTVSQLPHKLLKIQQHMAKVNLYAYKRVVNGVDYMGVSRNGSDNSRGGLNKDNNGDNDNQLDNNQLSKRKIAPNQQIMMGNNVNSYSPFVSTNNNKDNHHPQSQQQYHGADVLMLSPLPYRSHGEHQLSGKKQSNIIKNQPSDQNNQVQGQSVRPPQHHLNNMNTVPNDLKLQVFSSFANLDCFDEFGYLPFDLAILSISSPSLYSTITDSYKKLGCINDNIERLNRYDEDIITRTLVNGDLSKLMLLLNNNPILAQKHYQRHYEYNQYNKTNNTNTSINSGAGNNIISSTGNNPSNINPNENNNNNLFNQNSTPYGPKNFNQNTDPQQLLFSPLQLKHKIDAFKRFKSILSLNGVDCAAAPNSTSSSNPTSASRSLVSSSSQSNTVTNTDSNTGSAVFNGFKQIRPTWSIFFFNMLIPQSFLPFKFTSQGILSFDMRCKVSGQSMTFFDVMVGNGMVESSINNFKNNQNNQQMTNNQNFNGPHNANRNQQFSMNQSNNNNNNISSSTAAVIMANSLIRTKTVAGNVLSRLNNMNIPQSVNNDNDVSSTSRNDTKLFNPNDDEFTQPDVQYKLIAKVGVKYVWQHLADTYSSNPELFLELIDLITSTIQHTPFHTFGDVKPIVDEYEDGFITDKQSRENGKQSTDSGSRNNTNNNNNNGMKKDNDPTNDNKNNNTQNINTTNPSKPLLSLDLTNSNHNMLVKRLTSETLASTQRHQLYCHKIITNSNPILTPTSASIHAFQTKSTPNMLNIVSDSVFDHKLHIFRIASAMKSVVQLFHESKNNQFRGYSFLPTTCTENSTLPSNTTISSWLNSYQFHPNLHEKIQKWYHLTPHRYPDVKKFTHTTFAQQLFLSNGTEPYATEAMLLLGANPLLTNMYFQTPLAVLMSMHNYIRQYGRWLAVLRVLLRYYPIQPNTLPGMMSDNEKNHILAHKGIIPPMFGTKNPPLMACLIEYPLYNTQYQFLQHPLYDLSRLYGYCVEFIGIQLAITNLYRVVSHGNSQGRNNKGEPVDNHEQIDSTTYPTILFSTSLLNLPSSIYPDGINMSFYPTKDTIDGLITSFTHNTIPNNSPSIGEQNTNHIHDNDNGVTINHDKNFTKENKNVDAVQDVINTTYAPNLFIPPFLQLCNNPYLEEQNQMFSFFLQGVEISNYKQDKRMNKGNKKDLIEKNVFNVVHEKNNPFHSQLQQGQRKDLVNIHDSVPSCLFATPLLYQPDHMNKSAQGKSGSTNTDDNTSQYETALSLLIKYPGNLGPIEQLIKLGAVSSLRSYHLERCLPNYRGLFSSNTNNVKSNMAMNDIDAVDVIDAKNGDSRTNDSRTIEPKHSNNTSPSTSNVQSSNNHKHSPSQSLTNHRPSHHNGSNNNASPNDKMSHYNDGRDIDTTMVLDNKDVIDSHPNAVQDHNNNNIQLQHQKSNQSTHTDTDSSFVEDPNPFPNLTTSQQNVLKKQLIENKKVLWNVHNSDNNAPNVQLKSNKMFTGSSQLSSTSASSNVLKRRSSSSKKSNQTSQSIDEHHITADANCSDNNNTNMNNDIIRNGSNNNQNQPPQSITKTNFVHPNITSTPNDKTTRSEFFSQGGGGVDDGDKNNNYENDFNISKSQNNQTSALVDGDLMSQSDLGKSQQLGSTTNMSGNLNVNSQQHSTPSHHKRDLINNNQEATNPITNAQNTVPVLPPTNTTPSSAIQRNKSIYASKLGKGLTKRQQ